jgi:methionyl-tRNA formyltransferase
MNQTSKTIVFFGNERLATGVTTSAPSLRALIEAGYTVAAVIINNETATTRKSQTLEIAQVAAEHDIPVLNPKKLADIKEYLQDLKADIGLLVAYGQLVPARIIDLFPSGIINIHPSLLPLHRGSTPLESVILAGDTSTGVSIMQVVKELDRGPVYAQNTVSLTTDVSKQALADQLSTLGAQMLLETLPPILAGSLQPTVQDESLATYDKLITKADGRIDWQKPAITLEREIRAYYTWPRSSTTLGSYEVIIHAARVVDETGTPGAIQVSKDRLIIYTGRQALEILSLQPSGKKEMPIKAFLSGYKI